ncbi:MAG: pilus assembly protein PilC [Candidatus Eremiobacter antarcticus]|nr:type II secretion system F family protein [Candidatus Eremiobacteraeota bacterium]MBC5808902.1 type II secretion system F family protein [Candidatus Eremiobacteraeota bacterium]PZR60413.1 MAG: pilus assembly protein PilC [Candidatus Eremiobacter sp. RRmetagenome_bin22]
MPSFAYQAKDASGKSVNGVIEAENERVLRAKLREMNYYVTGITQKQTAGLNADVSQMFGGVLGKLRGVKEQSLVVFSRQFATMINAGLAMVRCLDVLGIQTEDAQLKPVIIQVRREVEGGSTLANALGKYPKVFSPLFINMVRAGELGGILDEVLNRLAGFLEKDFNLKKKVKAAMTYPMVILVMAVVIVIFLVTFILPTFVSLFSGMSMKLPLPTKILITFTNGARNPVLDIGAAVVLAILFVIFKRWTATQSGRFQFDKFKLKLPVFGLLIRKVAISRFCRTLGALLQSGVPIMQALEIVGKASGNEVVADCVIKVRESVREGESIAVPLNLSGLFPPLVTQMVAVGEETGNLDGMLTKIADFYDVEVEYMLASLTSLLEPLLILAMGFVVGFIVISVFLPLYQIIGNIK